MAGKVQAKGGMETSTILGIILGFGGIMVGFLLEGGSPGMLVGFSALIIIVTGTFGALMTSFTIRDILSIPALIKESMSAIKGPSKDLAQLIITFGEKSRREGLLSLEDDVESLDDKFIKKGIRMVVDGVDPEIVRNLMENEIMIFEDKKKEEVELFAQAGGFSPTMGIIGTVTGLVLVLSNLGGDASALGHSIAVAFIATLYGIGLANLFWLPIANKLKLKMKKEIAEKQLILAGVLAIQAGENPSLIKDRLEAFVEEEITEKAEEGEK